MHAAPDSTKHQVPPGRKPSTHAKTENKQKPPAYASVMLIYSAARHYVTTHTTLDLQKEYNVEFQNLIQSIFSYLN